MRFTLRLLGTEIFHVDTDRDQPEKDPDDWRGDVATNQTIGFTPALGTPIREPWTDETP